MRRRTAKVASRSKKRTRTVPRGRVAATRAATPKAGAKRKKRKPTVRTPPLEEGHDDSATAIAAEAWRTGLLPRNARRSRGYPEIPGEDETILVGDPDDDTLANEYVGDETPGGSASTPDQNDIDEIGRAYGLQEEDSGALRAGEEVLTRRDRHREELMPPGRWPD